MTGHVVSRVSRHCHVCKPPGWRDRRRLDLDFGSVWACECGRQWKWSMLWGEPTWVQR